MAELRPTSIGDRIIGTSERKRSTKTRIKDEKLAMALSALDTYANVRLVRLFRRLHERDHPPENEMDRLTDMEIVGRYPSILSYQGLHQSVTEHLLSIGGFGVRASVRMEDFLTERERDRSSQERQEEPRHEPAVRDGR